MSKAINIGSYECISDSLGITVLAHTFMSLVQVLLSNCSPPCPAQTMTRYKIQIGLMIMGATALTALLGPPCCTYLIVQPGAPMCTNAGVHHVTIVNIAP